MPLKLEVKNMEEMHDNNTSTFVMSTYILNTCNTFLKGVNNSISTSNKHICVLYIWNSFYGIGGDLAKINQTFEQSL